MQILLNGEPKRFPDGTTVAELIRELALADRRIATEINGAIVPRSAYAERRLADGDRVEIIHAVGGG
ncbi:MAG TPA: sulfur carrier protein ThiS [Gammaproteobacteria bacterium]|nr:sulfur carrier protein ThiS [Gammaproteobacteria bacterium]